MSRLDTALDRLGSSPRAVVVATTLVALLARLVELGHRVFYYDEAWFGYWALKFLDTGVWEYRPILHGPFITRINAAVFPVLGANDFTARLVVAAVGGLLPLAALLFRKRLRNGEVIALSLFLAFSPVLLYYSRFMRKDLPLAAFMLVTLGLGLRLADTGRPRYLYAGAATLGLAFTTKESVLLWVLTYLGAGALVIDRQLLTARYEGASAAGDTERGEPGAAAALRTGLRRAGRRVRRWWRHLLGATGLYLAVVVFFYAPRAGGTDRIGLWKALGGEFGTLPDVIAAATLGSFDKALNFWAEGDMQGHPYLPYLQDTLRTLAAGALAVCLLAVVGFLYDRYTGERPRPVVEFTAYSGGAAIVGYPLANFLPVPWSTVHAVVPLTVPAAVGACAVYRWGRGDLAAGVALPSLSARERVVGALRTDGGEPVTWLPSRERSLRAARALVAGGLLVLLAANVVATGVTTSYLASDVPAERGGSELVYYAQPPDNLREPVTAIQAAAATGGADTDVLYVGAALTMDEASARVPPPAGEWFRRIPLPWYTEAAGADVANVDDPRAVTDPPPVVITTVDHYQTLDQVLSDRYTREIYALDGTGDRTVVVYTRSTTE